MFKKIIIVIGVLTLAVVTTQAVEDGKGTNVVKNLRVQPGGGISLDGTNITTWSALDAKDQTARDAAAAAQATATFASNSVVGLNTRSNDWDTVVTKLDQKDGTATNLTVAGTFVQAVGVSTQEVMDGTAIIVNGNSFIPIIGSNSVAVMASLAGGTVGQIITLQGQDNTATVTLTNNPDLRAEFTRRRMRMGDALSGHGDLAEDCVRLFDEGSELEKAQAITLAAAAERLGLS